MHFIKEAQKGQKNQNLQRSINSNMEWIEEIPEPITQSNNVWKNSNLSSWTWRSASSKIRAFLSCQRHPITQCGSIFQTWPESFSPKDPIQQENRSITELGITHCTPKRPSTIYHISIATGQWRNKWSTLSPFLLHIQHQLWIIKPRFQRFSMVRAFPSYEGLVRVC